MSNAGADPDTKEGRGLGGVQSVDRAITVMEILAARGGAGVSELAEEIGVHKSTAFRLLAALEEHDLVRQVEDRGHYELGFGVLRLANSIPGRLDLVRQARPVMDAFALEYDETINIAVLRQGYVVNVGQSVGSSAVAYHNWIGELTPPHATSSGKVLLAYLSADQRRKMTKHLDRFTDETITSRAALDKELLTVKRTGYAVTNEELEVGLRAVAAPIRDNSGTITAALTASGPSYRFDEARMTELAEAIRQAAAEVSHRLGYFAAVTDA